MRQSVRSTIFVTAVLACPTGRQAQTAAAGLPAGPWAVGFTQVTHADSSEGREHRFEIGVWYPSARSPRSPLTYRDYFLVAPPSGAEQTLEQLVAFLVDHGAAEREVRAWLGEPMRAVEDAPPVGGPHPLVLIAQGNAQTIHDQTPLAEYLAGHGYVVATSPSPMLLTGLLTSEREIGARAAEQAGDLALHFYERLDPFMTPDFGLLTTLRAVDRWVVAVPQSRHHHFTSLGLVSLTHPGLRAALAATGGTGEAQRAVAEATLEFLDAELKNDSAAMARLDAGAGRPPLGLPERLEAEGGRPASP